MSINGFNPNLLVNQAGTSESKKVNQNKTQLQQDDFLKLLITQIQHQDPTNPSDSSKFLSDMAQFSTVEGINKMTQSMGSLVSSLRSQQALFASSLVGRDVLVNNNIAQMQEGSYVPGSIDVPYKVQDLTVNIYDSAGKMIREMVIGRADMGNTNFVWDGIGDNMQPYPAGEYTVKAQATIGNKKEFLNVSLLDRVQSVSVGKDNEFSLNLASQGVVPFDQVKRIN